MTRFEHWMEKNMPGALGVFTLDGEIADISHSRGIADTHIICTHEGSWLVVSPFGKDKYHLEWGPHTERGKHDADRKAGNATSPVKYIGLASPEDVMVCPRHGVGCEKGYSLGVTFDWTVWRPVSCPHCLHEKYMEDKSKRLIDTNKPHLVEHKRHIDALKEALKVPDEWHKTPLYSLMVSTGFIEEDHPEAQAMDESIHQQIEALSTQYDTMLNDPEAKKPLGYRPAKHSQYLL